MLERKEILAVLNEARKMDKKCEMFGASRHRYALNPPIRASFVRGEEERYEFKLPEDYFHFITEIGDGGAGPDYGIDPFVSLVEQRDNPRAQEYAVAYRQSLSKEFTPRQMRADEVDEFSIVTREYYEKNPKLYFVFDELLETDDLCNSSFFIFCKDDLLLKSFLRRFIISKTICCAASFDDRKGFICCMQCL